MKKQQVYTWIKRIDFFGKNIMLNMNGDQVYRTLVGGVTTLGTAAILIIVFLSSINSWLKKDEITASTSKIFSDDPPIMYLNRSQYMFAMNIEQDNFINNPYYDIQIVFRNDTRNSSSTTVTRYQKTFPMVQCTLAHWADLPDNYNWTAKFISQNFTNWLCPELDYQMEMRGVFSSNVFKYYKISIKDCTSNATINKTCKTSSEISTALAANNGYMRFQFYQSDNIMNADQETAQRSFLNDANQYLFSPGNLLINANFYFSTYTMNEDTNILVGETIESTDIPYFATDETYAQYVPAVSGTYSTFYFRKSSFQYSIDRSYTKVNTLISYIGGFSQAVVVVITFFIGFMTDRLFSIELANKLYDFEAVVQKKNNNQNQNKNSKQNDQKSKSSSDKDSKDGGEQGSPTKIEGSELRDLIRERAREKKKTKKLFLKQNTDQKINEIKRLSAFVTNAAESKVLSPISKPPGLSKKSATNSIELANIIEEVEPALEGQGQQEKKDKFFHFPAATPPSSSPANNQNKEQMPQKEEESKPQEISGSIQRDTNKKMTDIDQSKVDGFDINSFNGIQFQKQVSQDVNMQLKQQSMEMKPTMSSKVDLEGIQGVEFKTRKSFLIGQFKYLVEKQQKIKLSAGYFMNKIFCGKYFKSREHLLVDRASREIAKDLDVFNLIERIKEVEKMKSILFDREQQILFNFCPKPVLSLQENTSNLTRAQILERLKQIQIKKDSKAAEAKKELQKKQTLQQKFHIGGGKLLKNTIRAISLFKKGLKSAESMELDSYKYLYEAYDTIMAQDPKLRKRKNMSLINSLGREMKDIFETSNLIKFKDSTPKSFTIQAGNGTNTPNNLGRSSIFNKQKANSRAAAFASDKSTLQKSTIAISETSIDPSSYQNVMPNPEKKSILKTGAKRIQTFEDVDLKKYDDVMRNSDIVPIDEDDNYSDGGDDLIPLEKLDDEIQISLEDRVTFDQNAMGDNTNRHRDTVLTTHNYNNDNFPTQKDLLPKSHIKQDTPRRTEQQQPQSSRQSQYYEFNTEQTTTRGLITARQNPNNVSAPHLGETHKQDHRFLHAHDDEDIDSRAYQDKLSNDRRKGDEQNPEVQTYDKNHILNSIYFSAGVGVDQSAQLSGKHQMSSQNILISEYNLISPKQPMINNQQSKE